MKIFLTGGSGFIGHWVVKELLDKGHTLRLLIRNPKKIPSLARLPGVQILKGTLSDEGVIRSGLQGCDACVHIALGWGETPVTMLANDTAATVFLLQEAEAAGVEQFLYTSSVAAIGEFQPMMTEATLPQPVDLYGATKAASEAFIVGFCAKAKIRGNIIRPGYTFGNPALDDGVSQPDQRFVEIVRAAQTGSTIFVQKGDGTQFISAADLASLYSALLDGKSDRQIYHGLGGEYVTWEQVAKMAIEILDSTSQIVLSNADAQTITPLFDLGRIKREFGFEFSPMDGLFAHLRFLGSKLAPIDVERTDVLEAPRSP